MSKIKQIEPDKWQEFLTEFSARNYNRRARFEVFRNRGTQEEAEESHLEEVSLRQNGGRNDVVVIRIDRSKKNADKIKDIITNVRGISVQYDTDGSEDVLEITDDQNGFISLRMESRVDGVS